MARIEYVWIMEYLRRENAAQDRLRRILFKSLGGILTLQESIAERWNAAQEPRAAQDSQQPVADSDPTPQ